MGEKSFVCLQDGAQCLASADLFPDIGEESLDGFLLGLVHQDAEGFDQWEPGHEQRGKLPCHERQVGCAEGDRSADRSLAAAVSFFSRSARRLALLDDIGRIDAFLPQFESGDFDVLRVDDPRRGSAVISVALVLIDRHDQRTPEASGLADRCRTVQEEIDWKRRSGRRCRIIRLRFPVV